METTDTEEESLSANWILNKFPDKNVLSPIATILFQLEILLYERADPGQYSTLIIDHPITNTISKILKINWYHLLIDQINLISLKTNKKNHL